MRVAALSVFLICVLLPFAAPGEPQSSAPRATPTSDANDTNEMLQAFTAVAPCTEASARAAYRTELPNYREPDTADTMNPDNHVVESFRGRALGCGPSPFSHATFKSAMDAYESHLKAGKNLPLVIWVHGGLVAGLSGYLTARDRMCDYFQSTPGPTETPAASPLPTCSDVTPAPCSGATVRVPSPAPHETLYGFPIFVVWHSGFGESVYGSAFSSKTREATAEGLITRELTRHGDEEAFNAERVSHLPLADGSTPTPNPADSCSIAHDMNRAEHDFRMYDVASAPNLWHFMQDEIADTFAFPTSSPMPSDVEGSDRVGLWLVERLRSLHEDHPNMRVVLVGHSMGAEWISWLIETYDRYVAYQKEKAPPLNFDVIFMAPAVPYATFERALRTGRIRNLRIFTMADLWERRDDLTELDFRGWGSVTKGIYPYSLLYFISGVLNPYPDYPLLGLQRYMTYDQYRPNPLISDVVGTLNKYAYPCVFSPTQADSQPLVGLRSTAVHHGNFNGDPATTESIVYIINKKWAPPSASPWPTLSPEPLGATHVDCNAQTTMPSASPTSR